MEKKPRKSRKPSPDWVSISEVADYLTVDASTVSRGTRQKTWPLNLLRRVEIGGRVVFSRASFEHMRRAMRRAVEALPDDAASADVVSIDAGRRLRA